MGDILNQAITGPDVWLGPEIAKRDDWIGCVSGDEIDELNKAVESIRAHGRRLFTFTREDFPLPTLGPRLQNILDEVENGRGFALLRGLPVADYGTDYEALKILYWGVALHLGSPITQNARGDLICEITDLGFDKSKPNVRGYVTNQTGPFHNDSCDVVGLFCIHPSREGGKSRIASSAAVFNAILKENPDYLPVLFKGFHFDLRGEGVTGDLNEVTFHRIPIFSYHAGRFNCRYNARSVLRGAIKIGEDLSDFEQDALNCVRDMAGRDDIRLDMDFQQGDIQLNNNHSILHSRTAFIDWPEQEKKRCLYRLWMTIPNGRPLAPEYADRLNTGPRGGVHVQDGAGFWAGAPKELEGKVLPM
jgi:hypothetical protein